MKHAALKITVSFLAAFLIGLLTTYLLAEKVFFSLMLGIPAGIIAGIITFLFLKDKK